MTQIAVSSGASASFTLPAGNRVLILGQGTYRIGPRGTSARSTVDELIDNNTSIGPYEADCTVQIWSTGATTYELIAPSDVLDQTGRPIAGDSLRSLVSGAGVTAYTVDHIVSGLVLPTAGTNAAATMTAGAVNIAAAYIAVAGGVLGLANGDNYVDVNSAGTVVVTNVAQAAAAPALLANSIRLGYVRCIAGSVSAATTNARDSLGNWMGNRSPKAACILHAAPTAAVSSGTSYYPWDTTRVTTEVLDNANMHSLASNPSRVYCTKTGLYAVTFGLQWSSGTMQEIRLWKNGTAVQLGVSQVYFGANTTTAYGSFAGHVMLTAGDYLEVRIDATVGPLIFNASFSLVMC